MKKNQTLLEQFAEILEEKDFYQKENFQLKKKLEKKEITILELKSVLNIESLKNKILSNIVDANTDIKVNDIFEYNTKYFKIKNIENGNIPIIVENFINKQETVYNMNMNKTKKSGKIFRTLRNKELLDDENPIDIEEKVKKVEKNIQEIVNENNLDFSYEDISTKIENLFLETTTTSKNYINCIESIMNNRIKLLSKIKLSEYIKILQDHINKIEDIFIKKKFEKKKIEQSILKFITPLEKRFLQYGDYYNTYLETDDIQKFELSLTINNNFSKKYMPFTLDNIYDYILNYSIAIFPLKKIFEKVLINPYGFNNLIYLEKNNIEDPYSFYILEKIDNGNRSWKMECRLYDLSQNLSTNIIIYSICLFRKIYFDIFKDNIYRKNYIDNCAITQQDCEQLLVNIFYLINTKYFCNMFREIIQNKCVLKPTKLDKFNLITDDKLLKKKFEKEINYKEYYVNYLKQIFDNISEKDIDEIIINKINF